MSLKVAFFLTVMNFVAGEGPDNRIYKYTIEKGFDEIGNMGGSSMDTATEEYALVNVPEYFKCL